MYLPRYSLLLLVLSFLFWSTNKGHRRSKRYKVLTNFLMYSYPVNILMFCITKITKNINSSAFYPAKIFFFFFQKQDWISVAYKHFIKKFMCSSSLQKKCWNGFKGTLSGMRQFLATEGPLKVMKNAFYFTLEPLFVLQIIKLLFWTFLVI